MVRLTRNRILSAALAGASLAAFSLTSPPAMADGSIVVRNFVFSHGKSSMPWTSSGVNTHVTIEAKSRFVTYDG